MCLPNILVSLLALLFSQVGCTLENSSGKMEVLKPAKNCWWFGGFGGRLTGVILMGPLLQLQMSVSVIVPCTITQCGLYLGGVVFSFFLDLSNQTFIFQGSKHVHPPPQKTQINRPANRSLHSTGSIMRLWFTFDGYQTFWTKILRNEKYHSSLALPSYQPPWRQSAAFPGVRKEIREPKTEGKKSPARTRILLLTINLERNFFDRKKTKPSSRVLKIKMAGVTGPTFKLGGTPVFLWNLP